MIIRKAQSDDINSIMDIIYRVLECPDKNLINGWDETYPTKELLVSDIEAGELFVGVEEDAIVGLFALNHDDHGYETANWKYEGEAIILHRLCVDPAVQGKGFAAKILSLLEEYLKHEQYGVIKLDTFSKNPVSKKLYVKCGYEFCGEKFGRCGCYHCYEKKIR